MKLTIGLAVALLVVGLAGVAGTQHFRLQAQEARSEAKTYKALSERQEALLQAAQARAEALAKAESTRAGKQAEARVVITQQKKETARVVKENPTWAEQPLPDAVADRMRKYQDR